MVSLQKFHFDSVCIILESVQAGGLIASKTLAADEIIGSDLYGGCRDAMAKLGATVTDSNTEVVEKARVIIVAVKPNDVGTVLESISKRYFCSQKDGKSFLRIEFFHRILQHLCLEHGTFILKFWSSSKRKDDHSSVVVYRFFSHP